MFVFCLLTRQSKNYSESIVCYELGILEETAQPDMVLAIHRIINLLRMTSTREKMREKLNAIVCGPNPLCVITGCHPSLGNTPFLQDGSPSEYF